METTSTLSGNLYSYYHKLMLETAEAQLKMKQLGIVKQHPQGYGTDSFVLKWGNLSSATDGTPVTEGVVPTESLIRTNKYTISLKEYIKWVRFTDLLLLTAIDPVLEDASKRFGYAAARELDTIAMTELVTNATTSTQYVGTGNSVDNDISATETFTAPDVIKAVRVLKMQDAPEFPDGMYVWVIHPGAGMDIMSDTAPGGFIELNKYVAGLAEGPLKGEIGRAYGARVIESTQVQKVANTGPVNVYRTLVLAQDAFCITGFDKELFQLIVKQLGSGGTSDPANQIATVAYKLFMGVKYVGGSFTNSNGGSPDLCIQLRGAVTGG
jgi:N4-gp56 family major capsid protein